MLTGPSTSSAPSRIAGGPRRLTPREFQDRLFARVQQRYRLQLDEGWLHDLIKDALVPRGERSPNEGRRPIYIYGFQSYRRALQIARFRRDGFVERDAIRIQLFLKGYGERDIRQALWNQYSKFGKNLVAQVRSGYADNRKHVPEGHRVSLKKKMGPLDPRFVAAGFQLQDDKYIKLFRDAKQSDLREPRQTQPILSIIQELPEESRLDFNDFSERFGNIFSGALMFTATGDQNPPGLDPTEEIIRSTDEQYQHARAFFRFTISMLGVRILSSLEIEHDAEGGTGRPEGVARFRERRSALGRNSSGPRSSAGSQVWNWLQ